MISNLVALLAAAVLAGCSSGLAVGPASGPAPVKHNLVYGSGGDNAPQWKLVSTVRSQVPLTTQSVEPQVSSTASAPIVYSEEWQKREDAHEARLKRSTTICRC